MVVNAKGEVKDEGELKTKEMVPNLMVECNDEWGARVSLIDESENIQAVICRAKQEVMIPKRRYWAEGNMTTVILMSDNSIPEVSFIFLRRGDFTKLDRQS
ncbi:MAG: hypothetical protein WAV41_01980 [Microgenomates group bacterium]